MISFRVIFASLRASVKRCASISASTFRAQAWACAFVGNVAVTAL